MAFQNQLHNLVKGKTVITIANQLSNSAAMDRLMMMDNDRFVEAGWHEELRAAAP